MDLPTNRDELEDGLWQVILNMERNDMETAELVTREMMKAGLWEIGAAEMVQSSMDDTDAAREMMERVGEELGWKPEA